MALVKLGRQQGRDPRVVLSTGARWAGQESRFTGVTDTRLRSDASPWGQQT